MSGKRKSRNTRRKLISKVKIGNSGEIDKLGDRV
jgi:hypothetical protein